MDDVRTLTEAEGLRIQEDPAQKTLRVGIRPEVVATWAALGSATRPDAAAGAVARSRAVEYPPGTVGGDLQELEAALVDGADVPRLSLLERGLMSRVWSYRLPGGEPVFSSPIGPVTVYVGGAPRAAVVFCAQDWFIYALDAVTGALLWRTATGAACYGRCQAADVDGDGSVEIFAPSHDGALWALDGTGALRWRFFNVYDREASGTATAGTNATTLCDASKSWAPNAFLRAAGAGYGAKVRWTSGAAVGQVVEIVSRPDGQTCKTTVASPSPAAGDSYVIEPKYPSDRYWMHAGTLVHEGSDWFLYATGFDNHVYKLNAATGGLVWKFATLENIEPYPLVVAVAGQLRCIVVSIDGKTRSLDAASGELVWETTTGPCDAFLYAADVDGDGALEVLVASRDNRVYALDAVSGARKAQSTDMGAWDYGDLDCAAVPVKLPGETLPRVVTGGDAGSVWCLDGSLATRWMRPVAPNVINSSPVVHDILGRGGLAVLVGDMRGTLHVIDARTGGSIGWLYVKGGIEGVPLCRDIDGDGRVELVLTTTDGYVECYRFPRGEAYNSSYFPGDSAGVGHQG